MSTKDNKTTDNYTIDKKTRLGIEHWEQVSLFLAAYDAVAVTVSYFVALLLRFDFAFSMIPVVYLRAWELFAPFYVVICIAAFWRLRLYRSIWRFASYTELQRIVIASLFTTVMQIIGSTITLRIVVSDSLYTMSRMPVSYFIVGGVAQFFLITAIRFSYRFVLLLRASRDQKNASKVMLVGAGSAGQMILRDIRRTSAMSNMNEQVVCFIDDNKNKWNREVDGVPVVGGRDGSFLFIKYEIHKDLDRYHIALTGNASLLFRPKYLKRGICCYLF